MRLSIFRKFTPECHDIHEGLNRIQSNVNFSPVFQLAVYGYHSLIPDKYIGSVQGTIDLLLVEAHSCLLHDRIHT